MIEEIINSNGAQIIMILAAAIYLYIEITFKPLRRFIKTFVNASDQKKKVDMYATVWEDSDFGPDKINGRYTYWQHLLMEWGIKKPDN